MACSSCRVPSNPIWPPKIGSSKTWSTVSLAPSTPATRPASESPSHEYGSARTGTKIESNFATYSRTTRTGTSERRTTASATEPSRTRSSPVRACVPITMRSAFRFAAHSTISASASPVTSKTTAFPPTRARSSSRACSPTWTFSTGSGEARPTALRIHGCT